MSCMQEYLILAVVLRTAVPQICKRKSGSDQEECLIIPFRERMSRGYRVILLKKVLHFLEIANDDLNLYICDFITKCVKVGLFFFPFPFLFFRFPKSKGVAGHVATTGETLNITDAYHDERFNRYNVRDWCLVTETAAKISLFVHCRLGHIARFKLCVCVSGGGCGG